MLDEFGLAALGELAELVPSLVVAEADGAPRRLDREATEAFLRFALTDARRATIVPARKQVGAIARVVESSGAGPDTKIPRARTTVSGYLRATERDLRSIWPSLARRLRALRDGL